MLASQQRSRKSQATALTVFALAFLAALAAVFGPLPALIAAIGAPVPLVLLWLSADVFRADELAEEPRASLPTADGRRPVARTVAHEAT